MAKLTFRKKPGTQGSSLQKGGTVGKQTATNKPQLFGDGKNLLTNFDDDAWDQALGESIRHSSEGRTGDFITFYNRQLVKELFKSEFEPKPGQHVIEIIPYLTGELDISRVVGKPVHYCDCRVHFGVGSKNASYLCLLEMWGRACPICEWREKLRNKGYDKEVYKQFWPKQRCLYNILCLDSREELRKGIQFWHVSWHYMEKKLAIVAKKSQVSSLFEDTPVDEPISTYTQFSHPTKGKTIHFTIEPPVSKDDYESYEGHSFSDREHDLVPKLVPSAIQLDRLLIVPEYDEVREVFSQKVDEEELQERAARVKQEEDANAADLGADIAKLLGGAEATTGGSKLKGSSGVNWGSVSGKDTCEFGGEFGVDTGNLEECNECGSWGECIKAKKPASASTGDKKKSGLKLKW